MRPIEAFDAGFRELGFNQRPKKFKGGEAHGGVYAAFVAKAGIGIQAVAAGHGAGHDGVKPRGFYDDRGGRSRNA